MDKPNKEEAGRFLQAEIEKLNAMNKGLAADKAALIQEYVLADDEEAPNKIKKNIRARMPRALEVIDECLQLGGNDAKAVSAAKWIIEKGLTPESLGGADPASKELAKLLKALADND